ncbi:MAG TPA: hypothetical protein VFJ74_01160 [Gemmatimonadaceae bacterium]|nr:hypothetical protein [Gemmatimonadaceae bacterium]
MNAHPLKLASSAALAAALAIAALPAPAHAQFGGLLKKAKEKAAEKVAEKAVDKAAEKAGVSDTTKAAAAAGGAASGGATAAPANGGGRRTMRRGANGAARGDAAYAAGPAPTYSANLLEITNERIDQLFKGLDAERAYAVQRAKGADAATKKHDADMSAYEAKHAAYEKKIADINTRMTTYQNCMMSNQGASSGGMLIASKMQEKLAGMNDAEREKFMARMQDLGQRGDAAEKRGDKKTMLAIMDTVNTLMGLTEADRRAAAAGAKNHKDCGQPPAEMTNPSLMPVEPQPPHESGSAEDAAQAAADKAGAKAAGLTVEQYGVLRERIAALVMYNGRPGPAWGFSENERNAVSTRRNEFNKYEDILGGMAISWHFSGNSND